MKSRAVLKSIRVVIALLVIIPLMFLFIDFAGYDLSSIRWLAKIQFTPALLSALSGVRIGLIILILLIILTLLFGRVYCSVVCPLGIMQDIFGRIARLFKSKKKRRYRYSRPLNILRYSVLGLCIVLFVFGCISLISYLDPYSNFGRIIQNIVRPVYIQLNNWAVTVLGWFDNYSLYFVSVNFEVFAFWFSFIAFVSLTVLVFMRGRLFCNTLCPVGGILSLISRYSIFKLDFDKDKCNKCGLCEMKCKSQCIDSKQQKLDFNRCVICYNCINVCNRNAMNYKLSWRVKPEDIQPDNVTDNLPIEPVKLVVNSRRRFLGTAIASIGTVTLAYAQQQQARNGRTKGYTKDSPIAPPGAKSIAHLKSRCTACHLCVAQCPTQVIKPAFMEYGFGGLMMPRMDYEQHFCNFECTVCSEVCPNGALQPLTIVEKKVAQIGKVYFVKRLCVVHTDGTDCGACSEHCPTKAVDMVPYRDGLRIPQVNRSICIGCGGCEFICPVRPFRAIYVDGNPEHEIADKPVEEEKKDIELDDFGF
ncbi:MAG: 4Fe-4S binding protein [Prevotellaceae bacterium]|jgi:ferredoxin|nr:4Fe-4S binding protein [Prevotellaceae bacterium]